MPNQPTQARPPLFRRNLRQEVSLHMMELVLDGALPAGEPVGEEMLAERLGVSRTPVREALLELEHDGMVDAYPGRGFIVRPLTARDAREAYPLIWVLERFATESATVDPAAVAALRRVNTALKSARTARQRVALDVEWHDTLVASSNNQRLRAITASIKRVIQRYELGYMHDRNRLATSVREHEQIVDRLAGGRIRQAATLLEAHWRRGMDTVLAMAVFDEDA